MTQSRHDWGKPGGPVGTGFRLIVAGCVLATLTACFGDPAPDPETAPLEVVLDGCALNRDEVAAGAHEVSLVGDGQLVVTAENGDEALSLSGSPATGKVLPGAMGELVTTHQTYTFTCTVGDEETSATLRSVAASDG